MHPGELGFVCLDNNTVIGQLKWRIQIYSVSICCIFSNLADKHRNLSFSHLLDLSLPYAEISFSGEVCVMKAEGSGGVLNFSTCAEQLLYEVGDPSAYITPDVVSQNAFFWKFYLQLQ